MNRVLDASVYVAVLRQDEIHHTAAKALYEAHPTAQPYLVPPVFRLEVLAALARRGEGAQVLDAVDALVRGPRFLPADLDRALLEKAVALARLARLRAYDALYGALAIAHDAELVTLDEELAIRLRAAVPTARIVLAG